MSHPKCTFEPCGEQRYCCECGRVIVTAIPEEDRKQLYLSITSQANQTPPCIHRGEVTGETVKNTLCGCANNLEIVYHCHLHQEDVTVRKTGNRERRLRSCLSCSDLTPLSG